MPARVDVSPAMIRLCIIGIERSFKSIRIGAEGVIHDKYSQRVLYMPDNPPVISSNMGEPCWYTIGPHNHSLNIYEWGTNDVINEVQFIGRSYDKIMYATVVANTPLAFAFAKDGEAFGIITSHCPDGIWPASRRVYATTMCAMVDRTGQRLFIDACNAADTVEPFGEELPFGWCLPYTQASNTKMYAAFGDLVTCSNVNVSYIPVWDVRVKDTVVRVNRPARLANSSRCTFTNEHLLTVCFDYTNDDGLHNTTVWDLRNMDCYDLGNERYGILLIDMYAFCVHYVVDQDNN